MHAGPCGAATSEHNQAWRRPSQLAVAIDRLAQLRQTLSGSLNSSTPTEHKSVDLSSACSDEGSHELVLMEIFTQIVVN